MEGILPAHNRSDRGAVTSCLQIVALRMGELHFSAVIGARLAGWRAGRKRAVQMKIESHLMTEKRRSLRGVWVVILVLLLAAVGAAVYFLVPSDAQQRPVGRRGIDPTRPTPVLAASARTGDVNIYLSGLGTVTPLKTVTVRSRVDGRTRQGLVQRGTGGEGGRPPRRDRPAFLPGAAPAVRGQMARDQRCSPTPASTSSATARSTPRTRSPSSRSTRRRRWSANTKARSRSIRGRSTTPGCS